MPAPKFNGGSGSCRIMMPRIEPGRTSYRDYDPGNLAKRQVVAPFGAVVSKAALSANSPSRILVQINLETGGLAGHRRQKRYFNANCIRRGATEVWVITPKFAVPNVVPGLLNWGWLREL